MINSFQVLINNYTKIFSSASQHMVTSMAITDHYGSCRAAKHPHHSTTSTLASRNTSSLKLFNYFPVHTITQTWDVRKLNTIFVVYGVFNPRVLVLNPEVWVKQKLDPSPNLSLKSYISGYKDFQFLTTFCSIRRHGTRWRWNRVTRGFKLKLLWKAYVSLTTSQFWIILFCSSYFAMLSCDDISLGKKSLFVYRYLVAHAWKLLLTILNWQQFANELSNPFDLWFW